jgi:hypothetical protein
VFHRVVAGCVQRDLPSSIHRRRHRGNPGVHARADAGNLAERPYAELFEGAFREYVGADLPGNERADLVIGADGRLPLAEALRVLRPSGSLVLSAHGIWPYHPNPGDYWRWTPDGLRLDLERAGFETLDLEAVFGQASVAVQLWQDATAPAVPRVLRGV